jgi:hypothetical protein
MAIKASAIPNEERKRQFIYEYVGYPEKHPKAKLEQRGLSTIEAYTGNDDISGERLFPDSRDRQQRFARLCVDLIIESTLQVALQDGVPLASFMAEPKPLITLPKDMSARQLEEQWRKNGNSSGFVSWLAKQTDEYGHSCVRTIEDDPQHLATEERHNKELKAYKRALKSNPDHTEPAPIHPWQRFVSRHPILSRYFDINIPEPKAQTSAQEKRKAQASDNAVRRLTEYEKEEEKYKMSKRDVRKKDRPDEVKHLHVGTLPDINRLSIIPKRPALAEVFFHRLNYYHNEGHEPIEDEDRRDFHRSPLKMGPHGLHDQKNYVALTEDITSAAHARGVYGTIAEMVIISPEQNAARKQSARIYTMQRKLEGADHAFTVEHLEPKDIPALKKAYQDFRSGLETMLFLQEGINEQQRDNILSRLSPGNPIEKYTSLSDADKDSPAGKMVLEYCMRDAYQDFSTMQRAIHATHAARSNPEWRQAWLEAACAFNEKGKQIPATQRCVEPMEDVFLEMVAGKDLPLARIQQQAARQSRSR